MHAGGVGECSELLRAEASSQVQDVSVSMKRGVEKVGSQENESLEMVTMLMSLDFVLVNFKVAKLFCEDRFGDAAVARAKCATGWDIEGEEQMRGVKRRVVDEEHGLMINKLIELMARRTR